MSDSNRLFFKWRKINNEAKITEKIITLDKVLNNTESIFKNNFNVFEDYQMQISAKNAAVTKLVINNQNVYSGIFNKWRKMTKINKMYNF